jgi:hypothetical protein
MSVFSSTTRGSTDLWQQEPYAWKSYTLAANWMSRQRKIKVDPRSQYKYHYNYRICKYPMEYPE